MSSAPRLVILRVLLPDRPGVLGSVASRVGAVGGDVVGIDILERGSGQAVDELWLELPDLDLIDLLVAEVRDVDGVEVEDCHPADVPAQSSALGGFEAAIGLLEFATADAVLSGLAAAAVDVCNADGAVVVSSSGTDSGVVASHIAPGHEDRVDLQWLAAFAHGTAAAMPADDADIDDGDFNDLAVAPLARSGHIVVVSRRGLFLRDKERRIVRQLAAAADHRVIDVTPGDTADSAPSHKE